MAEVTITRLGHLGDGVADGPVFAPRTLPGEVVAGEVVAGRIAAPRILTPARERISPPCAHYRACGGCALQHAREAFVTSWKEDVIRQALAAHGLAAHFRPAHVSPLHSRRRANFAGRRLKKGALVGFHGRGSDTLTEITGCLILHPDLRAALPALEDLTQLAASRKATLTLALTRSEAGLDLQVQGAKPLDAGLRVALGHWAAQAGVARLACGDEVIAQATPPWHQIGPARVTPPPGAFLQATKPAELALQAAVTEAVGGVARVADLFAGCGTFALPLAQQAEVLAVEGVREMLLALDAGWRSAPGLRPVRHAARDLFRAPLDPAELAGFGAVVIDPPRAGAEAQARALARSAVPRIAAVSCNPVSFARDAALLAAGGYRLDWVQLIDQFRFSPHAELAAQFTKAHIAA